MNGIKIHEINKAHGINKKKTNAEIKYFKSIRTPNGKPVYETSSYCNISLLLKVR